MSKKYLLHRITEEDAEYIAEDTYTSYRDVCHGDCYLLVNRNNGKVFLENGNILIYKATGARGIGNENERRFLEAVEACAYFRGYANTHEINFKTSKIAELLYELEDHAIEIPDDCENCTLIFSSNIHHNPEIEEYIANAKEAFDTLNKLQRNLPTMALFNNEELNGDDLAQAFVYDFNDLPADNEEDYDEEDYDLDLGETE